MTVSTDLIPWSLSQIGFREHGALQNHTLVRP